MGLRDRVIRSQPPTDDDDVVDVAGPEVDSSEGIDETVLETASASTEKAAPADEFAAVLESIPEEAPAAQNAVAEASADGGAPEAPAPEPDEEKTEEEKLLDAYQAQTGESREQALAWLNQQKAAAAAQRQQPANENENTSETDEEKRKRQQQQMAPGRGSAVGSMFAGLGGALGGIGTLGRKTVGSTIRAGRAARDATARATGINRGAGLTPEVVRNRMFDQWHHEYESGVRGMDRSMEALIKAAASYNLAIKNSAPGRELEKIASARGLDIGTLISEVTEGKVDDQVAKGHVDALRADPKVQNAWSGVDKHNRNLEKSMGMMQGGMQKISGNFPDRFALGIETQRVSEILERSREVEKPFQIPANPIGDQKADGKSPQKSMWEQFQEMTKGGMDFLRGLVDKFSNIVNAVAAKFGGR